MVMNVKTVSIIGFGRFGQLMASLLHDDFEVLVCEDHLKDSKLVFAEGYKIVDFAESSLADAVILCMPISKTDEVTKALAGVISKQTIVIDTCSVKMYPVEIMKQNLPHNIILGTHPLFGPDSILAGLAGQKIIMCPDESSKIAFKFWKDFWEAKGVEIIKMSAEEHDRQAAFSQGLTHLVGRILGDMKLPKADISTKGSRALEDIVAQTNNDSWQLFDDLQKYNPYSKQMLGQFERSHDKIKQRLAKLIKDSTS